MINYLLKKLTTLKRDFFTQPIRKKKFNSKDVIKTFFKGALFNVTYGPRYQTYL